MRLIDAEILEIEMIKAKSFGELSAKGAIRKVQHAPTVDAEPVRHGHWLKNGSRYCECSVCHHEGNISGVDNYCPNCGATMDEVKNEAD